jgi:hypothetical protein
MLSRNIPHLRFDDPALGAIPKRLRQLSEELLKPAPTGDQIEPNW